VHVTCCTHQYKDKEKLRHIIILVLSSARQMHLTSSVHLSHTDTQYVVILLHHFFMGKRPNSQMRWHFDLMTVVGHFVIG